MNTVTTTKDYKGIYSVSVTTEQGNTFNLRLELSRKSEDGVTNTEPWNLSDEDDRLDLACGKWWPTKKSAVRFLKHYTLENNLYEE